MAEVKAAGYLPGNRRRGNWMRMQTAEILKRFFFLERALIVSQSGWLAAIAPLEIKTGLPRMTWQDALAADAMRQRVFELRYPSRLMEVGEETSLVTLFAESINAPSPGALLLSLARVFKPALLGAYESYLRYADALADAPTIRFLQQAVREKREQVALLEQFAARMLARQPEEREGAEAWTEALAEQVRAAGGVGLQAPLLLNERPQLPGRKPFSLAQRAARDDQFHLCKYYWPDIVIADFPYGEGLQLQLRSAISHFNEVWAVETGGAILQAFAADLEWEFIFDAARWTYDEARHTCMGYDRLREWGFSAGDIPLGSYIYDSARGEDAIVRLGMLHYFETKNIGKKTRRAESFASYNDKVSQHDMDFDWADETLHAHYGRRWHDALREKYPERIPTVTEIHARCDALVLREVQNATDADRQEILDVARAMLRKAERLAAAANGGG